MGPLQHTQTPTSSSAAQDEAGLSSPDAFWRRAERHPLSCPLPPCLLTLGIPCSIPSALQAPSFPPALSTLEPRAGGLGGSQAAPAQQLRRDDGTKPERVSAATGQFSPSPSTHITHMEWARHASPTTAPFQ